MKLRHPNSVSVLVNEDIVGPLSELWGVKESSLRKLCNELDNRKVCKNWKNKLMEIDKKDEDQKAG